MAVFVSATWTTRRRRFTARQLHEELPLAYQKRLVVDSKTELAFESNGGDGSGSRESCRTCRRCRAARRATFTGRACAHYVNDREVYRASTALILRSNGQLTGSSTPLGRRGIFWEIATRSCAYPHHPQHVPWWLYTLHHRREGRVAARLDLFTEERVRRAFWAAQCSSSSSTCCPSRDFQQEFEGKFVDDLSFFPTS